jgi:hypothetical protein
MPYARNVDSNIGTYYAVSITATQFLTLTGIRGQIFVMLRDIKFHEKPFNDSRVVTCG